MRGHLHERHGQRPDYSRPNSPHKGSQPLQIIHSGKQWQDRKYHQERWQKNRWRRDGGSSRAGDFVSDKCCEHQDRARRELAECEGRRSGVRTTSAQALMAFLSKEYASCLKRRKRLLRKKERLIKIIHETPNVYGINSIARRGVCENYQKRTRRRTESACRGVRYRNISLLPVTSLRKQKSR